MTRTVAVVSNAEQMAHVIALRAAVFMSEQGCPYEEEFDGNDYSSTHLVGYVDGRPVATFRIRWFAGFAHLGRLAALPKARHSRIVPELVKRGIEVVRMKGYTKVYGHAQKRLVDFWARFGFYPTGRNEPIVWSDHEYVEMCGDLPPHPDRVTMEGPAMKILRPEGEWDKPGRLEKSAERGATNPVSQAA
ncbi:MAG: GNAT family N-acetyltransferase [Alphaproteobacteria bacterium]|nr:GNAT family N-acetyltransferase [Alphaproteobacteria bacterium]